MNKAQKKRAEELRARVAVLRARRRFPVDVRISPEPVTRPRPVIPCAADGRITLVVCQYKEDVSWLCDYAPSCGIYVASKLEPTGWPGAVIENRGYEPFAYFHYFAEHYDCLPELCVCLQGNPWDHFGREALDELVASFTPGALWLRPLFWPGGTRRPHCAVQLPDGRPHHRGLGLHLDKWADIILGHRLPDHWWSWYGGQFAVSRAAIQARPLSFWKRCAAEANTREDGCAIERLWGYIFA